ncbi:hypothetical protein H257_18680 [Aphanomyces astaci]|uniref:Uncharacterized protein n=1 Tax=Aphanomyces astaci TaxID=112090 RepID=W4FCH2_APHAT|nr:hypothetical protein H257_18680 [Aphanomyces astaci]ETV64428.1 hypothetical protein H257_18680 [Aphanomyces astaci]|eukprot:XP_009846081.1 hypothetical protein H257_18680 [Aphanomyces astaci]
MMVHYSWQSNEVAVQRRGQEFVGQASGRMARAMNTASRALILVLAPRPSFHRACIGSSMIPHRPASCNVLSIMGCILQAGPKRSRHSFKNIWSRTDCSSRLAAW